MPIIFKNLYRVFSFINLRTFFFSGHNKIGLQMDSSCNEQKRHEVCVFPLLWLREWRLAVPEY